MRWSLLVMLLSVRAWADVPPGPEPESPKLPDVSCVGQAEGSSCGNGGRCARRRVRRPDFSQGVPPRWGWTEVMVCEGGAPSLAPWLSVVALLALVVAWLARGAEPVRTATAPKSSPPA